MNNRGIFFEHLPGEDNPCERINTRQVVDNVELPKLAQAAERKGEKVFDAIKMRRFRE
jgi:hypothetical protein